MTILLTVNVNRLRRKLEGIGLENMILTRKRAGLHSAVTEDRNGRVSEKIWKTAALFLASTGIMAMVLWLYNCPVEPVLYGSLLCMALFAEHLCMDISGSAAKRRFCLRLQNIPLDLEKLPFAPGQQGRRFSR